MQLRAEDADRVPDDAFSVYCSKVYAYLQVVEGRLFSEGLHVMGAPPSGSQMEQYLSAYFGEDLPQAAIEVVAQHGAEGSAAVRARLEAVWARGDGGSASSLWRAKADEAMEIRDLLSRNTEELTSVLRWGEGTLLHFRPTSLRPYHMMVTMC